MSEHSTTEQAFQASWFEQAACAGRSNLIDVEGDRVAEQRALAMCARCPVLSDCTHYALRRDVSGVCGGLTRSERLDWQCEHKISLDAASDFLPGEVGAIDDLAMSGCLGRGHGTAAHRARFVVLLANRGYTASAIGDLMGLSVRSVNRLLEIAVHHLGMTVEPSAVISVRPEPPVSIEGRGTRAVTAATEAITAA
jgi:hypothetical protein